MPEDLRRIARGMQGISTNLFSRAERALVNTGYELRRQLEANSPVLSGTYRGNWVARKKVSSSGVTLEIFNRTPVYGVFIEKGSDKGFPPWPNAISPPKGSTTEYGGKIFPYIAPGGVIAVTLKSFDADKFVHNVADQIFGRF